jgi:putative ABC transport system ATP-binding protein
MNENAEKIVVASGLTKVFRIGKLEVPALRGVDLVIHQGEFLALVGPSGSGKTTFLNLVGALDRPTGGELTVVGVRVAELSKRERAELRLRSLGFVFQAYNLVPVLTALENVEFVLELRGMGSERRARALDVLTSRLSELPTGARRARAGSSSGSLWHERSPHARLWSSPTNRPRISTARTPRSSCT